LHQLDALAKSLHTRVPVAQGRAGGQGQGRQRNIYAMTDNKPETGSTADLLQRIAHLEEQLKQAAGSSIMDFSEGIIKICPYQTVLSGMT